MISLFVLAGSIILLGAFFTITGNITSSPEVIGDKKVCLDSDGQMTVADSRYVAGHVTTMFLTGKGVNIFTDYCASRLKVQEFRCDVSRPGAVKSNELLCDNGDRCLEDENGARCVTREVYRQFA